MPEFYLRPDPEHLLSDRELELLGLTAALLSAERIAAQLSEDPLVITAELDAVASGLGARVGHTRGRGRDGESRAATAACAERRASIRQAGPLSPVARARLVQWVDDGMAGEMRSATVNASCWRGAARSPSRRP